ncbi:AsnC family transcriptional regulator [Pseudochrobactrum sp. sp1633]|uniref:Lrp/AsnC family transcriptional regulator n=1 Tax=Pseudochrobactrum sp. sp1633 TaxID=3036706 RepID=UPI0025A512F5|nr:AsnC family transcriptional regulator [Pseudochrobactrum sp. sp1633]MDM8347171.1 AsnC family transcriptional regulator [Pseudochrobactrum sp. sp1633]
MSVQFDRPDQSNAAIELASEVDFDDKDLEIVSLLQRDGRMLFTEIAQIVNLTEKTVRARVQSMLDSHAISIIALTTPAALGYRAIALVGLTCAPGYRPSDVAQMLAQVDGIDYVVVTSGRYSIIIEIVTLDRMNVLEIVQERVVQEPGVASFEVFEGATLHYQKAGFLGVGYKNEQYGVQSRLLSDADLQIAAALAKDGRASYRSVSIALGVSETQVRTRVAAMIASKQMQILAIANPLAFADRVVAWVALKVSPNALIVDIVNELESYPEVTYILSTFGRFELFVEVQAIGLDVLHDVIHQQIKAVSGVRYVEAFPYFKLHYKPLI